MKKLKRVELDGESVYFKKGLLGWHVVYPSKIDGKINWKNLIAGGNYWRLLIVALFVLLVLGCIWEFTTTLNIANECLNKTMVINITGLI